ncbi:MAG: caspase domain-containing protein [Terracidiphilus sp.]
MRPNYRLAVLVPAILLAGLCVASRSYSDDGRCGSGQDLVVQALERVTPQSPDSDFVDALELLKHAVSTCPELGDAWYYRSLVEQRLGHASLARYAMDKARFNGSEALDQNLNPLILSTPASRGFSQEASTPAAPAAPPVKPGPVQQKWALIIGIGNFTDAQVPRLNFTTADADAFAAALKDPNIGQFPADNVQELTNENATTKNIKEKLNWIARQAQPNDLVIIYVATHGTPRTIDSAGGANYLVTYDTEVYKDGSFDEDAMYATAYPMIDLANAVATRMKALRTAVFLDTCYSGGSVAGAAPSQQIVTEAPSKEMLSHMTDGTGRIVMAASQVDQESLESPDLHHGYFTYYLLQALKNGKGQTPLSQVFASVEQQVSKSVAAKGAHQDPVMNRSSSDADFALRSASADTASAKP